MNEIASYTADSERSESDPVVSRGSLDSGETTKARPVRRFGKWSKLPRPDKGVTTVLGVSAVAALLLLPVGIIPRLWQSRELDATQAKQEKAVPFVTTTHAVGASNNRTIALPGTVEALTETPVYAGVRQNQWVCFTEIRRHRGSR